MLDLLRSGFARLAAISRHRIWRRRVQRLRLCETLSLGNRGFLAVVRYEEQRFLVGGTNTSIALLAQLSSRATFEPDSTPEEDPAT
ncbi:MAG TPA: flagellar biosynthetic protein FliO [Candidatus Sulfotelmatobacter sp.]|nr:flagellar biosynthetic protein FliO [Candidatus Sulfotelmatobacter sp.]